MPVKKKTNKNLTHKNRKCVIVCLPSVPGIQQLACPGSWCRRHAVIWPSPLLLPQRLTTTAVTIIVICMQKFNAALHCCYDCDYCIRERAPSFEEIARHLLARGFHG